MKKRIATTLLCVSLVFVCASLAPAQTGAPAGKAGQADTSPANNAYDQALALYQQGQYDAAANLLQGPCAGNPYDMKINSLLARAQLDKCAQLKKNHDKTYRYLIKQPYLTGLRLLKANPALPGPYHLVARSLLINNRPYKAARYMKKAVYFAGAQHPDYAQYMLTYGDCCAGLMMRGDTRGYGHASKFYKTALSAAKEDAELTARIKARLAELEKNRR